MPGLPRPYMKTIENIYYSRSSALGLQSGPSCPVPEFSANSVLIWFDARPWRTVGLCGSCFNKVIITVAFLFSLPFLASLFIYLFFSLCCIFVFRYSKAFQSFHNLFFYFSPHCMMTSEYGTVLHIDEIWRLFHSSCHGFTIRFSVSYFHSHSTHFSFWSL